MVDSSNAFDLLKDELLNDDVSKFSLALIIDSNKG